MTRWNWLLFALLALANCAETQVHQSSADACRFVRLAEAPLEQRGNMLFIGARIAGERTTLLVDTGAEKTLLTEATVERLHLQRDLERATRTFGIGSSSTTWDARLPDGLTIGDTRFPVEHVTVGQFSIDQIAGGRADGLLGADILLAFDLDLDLPANRVTFYRPRRGCGDTQPPWSEPFVAVDGIRTRLDRMLVPFELDGVNGMAVLDTGAQLSSISERMIDRLGLAEVDLIDDRTVMAHGASPDLVPVRIHRFRTLRVGPAIMHGAMLPVVPMSSGMGDALVGGDFLRGRRIWLSLSSQRLFITPIERGPWIAATRTDD